MAAEGRKTCCECGGTFQAPANNFYRSYSELWGSSGYLPVCKECIIRRFEIYIIRYKSPRLALQRLCMAYDIYYSDKLFAKFEEDGFDLGKYMKKLNMVQYQGKTFDTSLAEGFKFSKTKLKDEPKTDTDSKPEDAKSGEYIDPELEEKWGAGFRAQQYLDLENHYKYLKSANPRSDSNQEIFIRDLCYTKMQQMDAVRRGVVEDFNKLTDSYRKTFSQAGLKTVQDQSAADEFTIGVNAETIEKYTPAEYYKNKKLYKDYDGIGDYITRFMLRPLRNLRFGTTDRDTEFFVEDGKTTGDSDD